MNWLNLLGIAVGLAMDAFAVSISAGLTAGKVTPRQVFRLAFHFGLFQFMMPIAGWWAGSTIASVIAAYDHWLAFGLLTLVGGKMWLDAWRGGERKARSDPTSGWLLVALSVATSIDALTVGFSLAFLRIPVLFPCIVIGIVAALFSGVGITFGSRLGRWWGRAAETLGGGILVLIGIRIVAIHLA